MGKKSQRSRTKAVKSLTRKVIRFFTALNWLMGFVLTALLLWDKLFG